MKNPKVLYILISIFCVFAIIAGIYAQFIDGNSNENTVQTGSDANIVQEKTQQEISNDFTALFTNTLNLGGFDTTGIAKLDNTKEIVYSAYDVERNTENYELNLHIPVININSELSNTFNRSTLTTFINKANEIIEKNDSSMPTLYSVDYAAFINDNVLSVVIKSTLKEGDSSQRIMVQTYNYNLSTNTEVPIIDLITMKQLNRDEVNNKIMQVVSAAAQEDQTLQDMGYNQVYVRDLTNEMYIVENAGAYFLGANRDLYIVYAYGNAEFTSKMDIIYFE